MFKYVSLAVIVILAAVLLSSCARAATGSMNTYPRQLNASGQGKVYVVTDMA